LEFLDPGWACNTSNAPAGTNCDTDGDVCNGVNTCDGAGTCQVRPPPPVDDGNPATLDYCGPDGVKHVAISSNGTGKEAFSTPQAGPDPRSRALPVAPNVGGPVVDESRGTLNYRYSFELPAARGRYQPRLDLTYSSSSTYNDAIGAGWSLTSFYIEIDVSTPPTSSVDTVPRAWWLVADGTRSRLLKNPGEWTNDWRTEVQGPFVSITKGSGPWTAVDAVGNTYTFSRTAPSTPRAGVLGRWYLDEVVDVDGNKTKFTYQDETGAAALLSTIEYNHYSAGTAVGTSVELTWSPDYQGRYHRAADTVAYRSNILRTVRIKGASTAGKPTILRHELTYTHQQQADTLLLSQVVVKAGESAVALPPTTFDYQQGTTAYQLAPGATLGLEGNLTSSPWNEQWLDLDGDGRVDRVAWPLWRRNTTSLGAATPTFEPAATIANADLVTPAPVFGGNPQLAALMDVNGDGLSDLVTVGADVTSGPRCDYEVRLGLMAASTYSLSATRLCFDLGQVRGQAGPGHFGVRYTSTTIEAHALMDVNGDGFPDLAQPDTATGLLDVWLGYPTRDANGSVTGFSLALKKTLAVPSPIGAVLGIDLNGDGLGGDYASLGGLTEALSSVVFGEGEGFSFAAEWRASKWGAGGNPISAKVQPAATLPVPPATLTVKGISCPESSDGSLLDAISFDDPRRSMALVDLNGDGTPDLLLKPSPSDPTCGSAHVCVPGENALPGATCYDPSVACPLFVYWNTGAAFELGGSVAALNCGGGGSCPGELLPFASAVDPTHATVTCKYRDPILPLFFSGPGTSTFPGWSAQFIDLDGDGLLDYVTNQGGTWTFFKGKNAAPLLNKVTTAAGAAYSVTYSPGTQFGAGPLDGARDVVTQVVLSGAGIPTATTNYRYSGPQHLPNPANFNRVEPRGFGESWSWLEEQGGLDKVAKHVAWVTTSALLAGSPSQIEWGTFRGNYPTKDPPSSDAFSPFKTTTLKYQVKVLDSPGATCVAPTALTAASFPVLPITTLVLNLDVIDTTTTLGGQQTRGCDDVDAIGNVLKTSVITNGTWSESAKAFLAGNNLVETTTFDLNSTCKTCPMAQVLTPAGGTTPVSATNYLYDSPVSTWSMATSTPGTGHLNYVRRWVSGTRWDTESAQAYNTDGTVQYRVIDPYPGSHARSTTESYTYDAQQLRVTLTTRTDGVQSFFTSATYDTRGLLVSQSGPYLTGGAATAPTQAFARDAFGRVVAVGRSVTVNGTTGAVTVTGAMAATEYVDTSPPVVKSYTFLAPTTFAVGAVPVTPDVKQVVEFKDRLGRTTEVRERLGVAGTGSAASQVIQSLSLYRVVSLVQYDTAGRVVASLEPTMTADGATPSVFGTVAATAGLRGAKTVYDVTGRVICSKSGVYTALGTDADCTSSTASGAGFKIATKFEYGSASGSGSAMLATVTVKVPGQTVAVPPSSISIGTTTTFRADGRVQDVIDPAGNAVTTSYDPLGRAIMVTRKAAGLPAVASSTRTLDGLGRVTEEWDDNWSPGTSPSRTYTYDKLGRAYHVELAQQYVNGGWTRATLDYEFKSLGRPTKITVGEFLPPANGVTRWNVRQLAAFAYDLPYNSNGALYTNTAGRLASVLSPNTTIALGYDQNGQVIRRDQWVAGLTGAFTLTGAISDDGRMLSGSFFSGYSKTVNYFGRYDSAGRPVRVDAGGASATAAPVVNLWEVRDATSTSYDGYDVLGRVGRLRSNGGTVDTYRNYDLWTGALSSQAAVLASGTRAYGIDKILYVGAKLRSFKDTTIPGTVTSYGYTYDEAGRLATATATRVGGAAISQGYGHSFSAKDPAPAWTVAGASMENLEVVSDVRGVTDYAYQGDRATALTGALSASISYDHAGRATSRSAGGPEVEGFVHDALDRLTQIRRNGAVSEILEYAPTGEPVFRKLGTQGTWYVGAVGTVTATVAAGCTGIDTVLVPAALQCVAVAGTVKVAAHVQVAGGRVASIRAAAGTGVDPVSEVLYYHRDMQGSVVATTYRSGGLSGTLGARYRYTPYGQLDRAENVSPSSDSELGYTGGLRLGYAAGVAQQGNLVLLGARVYHAELKRWLVPDTVDGRRYTYAGGDPVNFTDPGGRMPIDGGDGGGGVQSGGRSPGAGPGTTLTQLQLAIHASYPACSATYVSENPGAYCTNEFGEVVSGFQWYAKYMVKAVAGEGLFIAACFNPMEANPNAWNTMYATDRGVAVATLSPTNMYGVPTAESGGGGAGGEAAFAVGVATQAIVMGVVVARQTGARITLTAAAKAVGWSLLEGLLSGTGSAAGLIGAVGGAGFALTVGFGATPLIAAALLGGFINGGAAAVQAIMDNRSISESLRAGAVGFGVGALTGLVAPVLIASGAPLGFAAAAGLFAGVAGNMATSPRRKRRHRHWSLRVGTGATLRLIREQVSGARGTPWVLAAVGERVGAPL
jgi:RHS repeat-associated protein